MKKLFTILLTTIIASFAFAQEPITKDIQILSETELNDFSKPGPETTGVFNNWAGTINSNWNTAGNWSLGHVPTSSEDVTISAGTPYQPTIGNGTTASCRELLINSGAILSQVAISYFYVYGNFNSDAGTFTQSGSSYLYFSGSTNTSWDDDNEDDTYRGVRILKDNSYNYVSMFQNMSCGDNFEIREGEFYIDPVQNWTLSVTGFGINAFQVENGGKLHLVGNQVVDVAGGVQFENGSQVNVTGGIISCAGDFQIFSNTSYDIAFVGGEVVMDGTLAQYIDDQDGGTLEFYNLTINKIGGACYIKNADLDVNNNLSITGPGILNCNNGPAPTNTYNIHIGNNWNNTYGPASFNESYGRVIFDGDGHQYCSNEEFNELEINKTAALRMNGTDVFCNAYDWTAGAIDVLTGSFTAADLVDPGIYGSYYTNPGGTINIANYGSYVDLCGELNFSNGGTINVYGGESASIWPYMNDAAINMVNDGILDFKDQGIHISSTTVYNLDYYITGGTIRTSKGFECNRSGFDPLWGTLEFYGPSDAYISHITGCAFNNVEINKSASVDISQTDNDLILTQKMDQEIFDESKSNTVFLSSNILIDSLFIISGSFDLNGFWALAVNMDVYGELVMNNSADSLSVYKIRWHDGSTDNVTDGGISTYFKWEFLSGTNAQLGIGNTVWIIGSYLNTSFVSSEANASFGNLYINKDPGTGASVAGFEPFHISGNMTISGGNKFSPSGTDLVVDGTLEIENTGRIDNVLINTEITLNNDFTLHGELDLGNGTCMVHGLFDQFFTGILNIEDGILKCDGTGLAWMAGILNQNNGLLEFTNSSLNFYGTSNIYGGLLRVGGSFTSIVDGTFQPPGGTFEFSGGGDYDDINMHSNNYFNNLVIARDYFVPVEINTGTSLNIKNDLSIYDGALATNDMDLYIGGDWTNFVGTSGFREEMGRVIFNGIEHQTIYPHETFFILETNMSNAIRINHPAIEITCQIYDWTAGGIDVLMGTFTALDLADDGLYGGFWVNPDGTINLYQDTDPGSYVDLNGGLYFSGGGTINVYGGYDNSYWPYSSNASISMDGGVLDFKNTGIRINNDLILDEDITGGTIRTTGDFKSYRSDFTPEGGTIEFYGGNGVNLYCVSGSNLYSIEINKSGGKDEIKQYTDRKGNLIQSKSPNTVELESNIEVPHFVWLNEGILDLYGYTASCSYICEVNDGSILKVNNGSTLALGSGSSLNINNGGRLEVIGNESLNSTITRISSNYYYLSIKFGGTIAAQYALFEHMSWLGLELEYESLVDPAYSFHNCTFINHNPVYESRLFTIMNEQDFTVNDAVFPNFTGPDTYNVWKFIDAGNVTFINPTGAFAGPFYEADPYDKVHWNITPYDLELTAYLEGPYNPSTYKMNTDINGIIPLVQPYGNTPPGNPTPDWLYLGEESVGAIPNPWVVDWVLVELRDATDVSEAFPTNTIFRQPAFVLNTGEVVSLDGLNMITSPAFITHNIFAIIWHRNHLGIISATPLIESAGTYSYNFTTSASQAYGGTSAQIQLSSSPVIWGMMAGDGDGSGYVEISDKNNVWNIQSGNAGYLESDYSLNKDVNNQDKNDYWLLNRGKGSFIPE